MPSFTCDRRKCGHPFALHSNGKSPCKATGCSAMPDGSPCEGFLDREEPEQQEAPPVKFLQPTAPAAP